MTDVKVCPDAKQRKLVNEYAMLVSQQEAIKRRIYEIKAEFEQMAADELRDTKTKTATYWGHHNSRVTVTETGTVKLVSAYMLAGLLGPLADDFITTKTTHNMTEPCKRLLGMVCQGNYTEGSLEQLIGNITQDDAVATALRKKIKGHYEKDKATIMQLAGLSEEDASTWAYLAAEVINYEWLAQVLRAAGWSGSIDDAVKIIRAAAIVDESVKVSISSEE